MKDSSHAFTVEIRPGNCWAQASLKITEQAARDFASNSPAVSAVALCSLFSRKRTSYGKSLGGCTDIGCTHYIMKCDLPKPVTLD